MGTMSPAGSSFPIRAERASRHFYMGKTLIRAVDEVTLSVRKGEFLGMPGNSGSGKSTLLNLIAELDRRTAGAMIARRRNLAEMKSRELARYRHRTVGIVFQASICCRAWRLQKACKELA